MLLQINYNSFIAYISLIIKKVIIEIKIDLDIKVSTFKMVIGLDFKIVKINKDDIYMKIDLIWQDTMVLL